MCRRDAAENAGLRASSVMLTACLGSEPGTLRESGNCCRNLPWMRPCPCVSAEGRRHGGTGRERARKSDPRVKNGRFLTQYASHFPHLALKLCYNYTPTMLLHSWSHGGSLDSSPSAASHWLLTIPAPPHANLKWDLIWEHFFVFQNTYLFLSYVVVFF